MRFGDSYRINVRGSPASSSSCLKRFVAFFGKNPINIPIATGGLGHGGRAHAIDEYYVIEGAGKVYGLAGAEKGQATILYNFAGKT